VKLAVIHDYQLAQDNPKAVEKRASEIVKGENKKECQEKTWRDYISHICTPDDFRRFVSQTNDSMDADVYESVMRWVRPIVAINESTEWSWDEKQMNLVTSQQQRIKYLGVAGSGKTEILCNKVANAIASKKKSLVLTFNLALINLLERKIGLYLDEDVDRKYLTIINYHQWFNLKAEMAGTPIKSPNEFHEYENVSFFEEEFCEMNQYDAVFVDEVQDFELAWLQIVNRFLRADGRFVVCGEVNQNIYRREVEAVSGQRAPRLTNLGFPGGPWTTLTKSYDLKHTSITNFANVVLQQMNNGNIIPEQMFDIEQKELGVRHVGQGRRRGAEQMEFDIEQTGLGVRYVGQGRQRGAEQMEFDIEQTEIRQTEIRYITGNRVDGFAAYIKPALSGCTDKEICYIGNVKHTLRIVEKEKRDADDKEHERTILKKEKADAIEEEVRKQYPNFKKKEIRKIIEDRIDPEERPLKVNFDIQSHLTKFSSIHSFKGYRADTVVLILSNSEGGVSWEEIYTGITRAKKRLFILDLLSDDDRLQQLVAANKDLFKWGN
jgi:hypothetical protein